MKTLFKLLLTIALLATGWMSWLAKDFKYPADKHFSIMALELPADSASLTDMITNITPATRQSVLKQLNADYIFMPGCYLAILVLCLIAIRHITNINSLKKDLQKLQSGAAWKKILMVLALLQLAAWGLDVWENAQIEQWLLTSSVNNDIGFFKAKVYIKFAIAFAGFFTAALLMLFTGSVPKKLSTEKSKSIPVNVG
jgi:hypothetical protein